MYFRLQKSTNLSATQNYFITVFCDATNALQKKKLPYFLIRFFWLKNRLFDAASCAHAIKKRTIFYNFSRATRRWNAQGRSRIQYRRDLLVYTECNCWNILLALPHSHGCYPRELVLVHKCSVNWSFSCLFINFIDWVVNLYTSGKESLFVSLFTFLVSIDF